MKKYKHKDFKYIDRLVEWVNNNDVEIITITTYTLGEGYHLIYLD